MTQPDDARPTTAEVLAATRAKIHEAMALLGAAREVLGQPVRDTPTDEQNQAADRISDANTEAYSLLYRATR